MSSSSFNPMSFMNNSQPRSLNLGLPFGGTTNGVSGLVPSGVKNLFNGSSNFYNNSKIFEAGAESANESINYTVLHDASGQVPADTGFDMVIFIGKNSNNPHGKGSIHARQHKQYSVSAMNYHLKYDREFIARYGSEQTMHKFFEDFDYIGVLRTENNLESNLAVNGARTVAVSGRAKIHNVWASQPKFGVVREGCAVYFVARRYKLDDPVEHILSNGKRNAGNDISKKVLYKTYWQFDAYSTDINQDPSLDHFSYGGDDIMNPMSKESMETRWVGAFIRIGIVHEYHGEASNNDKHEGKAIAALYPTQATFNSSAKDSYYTLPHLIVMQRLK